MSATAELAFDDSRIAEAHALAGALFDDLRANTSDGDGIVRDTYGEGENYAHALVARTARSLGLEIAHDAAANTYMTLPGRDRSAPRVIVGSHLDSVQNGGNYDGAAGVIAGLAALSVLRAAGIQPECDISVMGIRAEESAWFSVSYLGSRAALGTLPEGVLDTATRVDTGRTLSDHLASAGGDPEALRSGTPYLKAEALRAFLEVHIEQGPVLVGEDLPVGIVTGVRGNFRYPRAQIRGEYQHCGGVPRDYRKDSVVAAAELVSALDRMWQEFDRNGQDMAFTVGKLFTDARQHALTKVAGHVEFSLDVRSLDPDLLVELERRVEALMGEIGERKGVVFDTGVPTRAAVGKVDPSIMNGLVRGAEVLGIPSRLMGSGAAHDAAAFAAAGVPMGMIFVRNTNGSHNPREAMEMADFMEATRLLIWWLIANCTR